MTIRFSEMFSPICETAFFALFRTIEIVIKINITSSIQKAVNLELHGLSRTFILSSLYGRKQLSEKLIKGHNAVKEE